jgi:hemerythrin
MKWQDTYATGVQDIDEQHKLLFKASEDYRTSLDHGEGQRVYGLFLEFLDSYARAHFGQEEECMKRHRCPVALQNSRAHAAFLEVFATYRQRHATNGFDVQDARELVDFLDGWLASHIARIDVQLKPCVNRAE